MKSTDDLPDDEGTMFIAWSPNANFAVSGRRGRDGELYVGSIYQDASMSTLKGVTGTCWARRHPASKQTTEIAFQRR
jgi:hypothetical protein